MYLYMENDIHEHSTYVTYVSIANGASKHICIYMQVNVYYVYKLSSQCPIDILLLLQFSY